MTHVISVTLVIFFTIGSFAACSTSLVPAQVATQGATEVASAEHLGDSTPSIVVGIIDSGLETNLPHFSCFNSGAAQSDPDGHGTLMASIVVGLNHSLCPEWAGRVKLKSYPVFRDGAASTQDIATALDRAVADEVKLLNMSISVAVDSPAVGAAVARAIEAGMIIVAAAGNNMGLRSSYPARYPNVISVGSLDAAGAPSNFSSTKDVDYFAWGEDVPATDCRGAVQTVTGTSPAAASVTNSLLKILLGVSPADGKLLSLIPVHSK